jgi:hypothetical protein
LYEQAVAGALSEQNAALVGLALGSEGEPPTVQAAIDQLDGALEAPIVPTAEDAEKRRLRAAIGLPETAWGK